MADEQRIEQRIRLECLDRALHLAEMRGSTGHGDANTIVSDAKNFEVFVTGSSDGVQS